MVFILSGWKFAGGKDGSGWRELEDRFQAEAKLAGISWQQLGLIGHAHEGGGQIADSFLGVFDVEREEVTAR
jgi:hypothetical protein